MHFRNGGKTSAYLLHLILAGPISTFISRNTQYRKTMRYMPALCRKHIFFLQLSFIFQDLEAIAYYTGGACRQIRNRARIRDSYDPYMISKLYKS